VKQLTAKLLQSQGLRDSFTLTAGNMGSTAVSAIALILFSRSLGPTEFGAFSTAFSLSLLVARLADFGINQALQRLIAQTRSGHTGTINPVQAVIISRIIIVGFIFLFGLLFSRWLAFDVFNLDSPILIYTSLMLVGFTIFFDLFAAIFQAYQRFITTAIIAFAQAFLKLGGAIYLMFAGISSSFIALVVYLVAPAIGVIAGLYAFRRSLFQAATHTTSDLKIVWQTGRFMSLAIISAAVAEHIDVLITQATLDTFQTGQFSAAARIAMFVNLIGMSIGTVLSVRVAKYKDKLHLDRYLKKAVLISLGSAAITLLAIPFGAIAIQFTVGDAYMAALPALSLLLVATAIANATSPFIALFYVFPKAQYYSYVGILLMVSLVTADLILIPRFGLEGAGYARIMSRALVLAFTLYYAWYSYRDFFKPNPKQAKTAV
jgi:O-antigen/teichoic acid export membrane protein